MDAYRTPDDDTRDAEIAALRDELDRMRTTIDRLADREPAADTRAVYLGSPSAESAFLFSSGNPGPSGGLSHTSAVAGVNRGPHTTGVLGEALGDALMGVKGTSTKEDKFAAGVYGEATRNGVWGKINVTVSAPTGPNFVSVVPGDATGFTTSTLNFAGGSDLANASVVKLGADRQIRVFAGDQSGSTHLIVDINRLLPLIHSPQGAPSA